MHFRNLATVLILATFGIVTEAARPPVTLIWQGQPRAVVVMPDEPTATETLAARELVEHLHLISGVELSVVRADAIPDGLTPVRLGAAADAVLDPDLLDRISANGSAFALVAAGAGIAIRGRSDEGTLFGVYDLLEQLGVRWYVPGDLGRVLPVSDTLALAPQERLEAPAMDYRVLQAVPATAWSRRVRLGGDSRPTGAHGLPGSPPRGTGRQTCLSGHHAPGALEAVVGAVRERLKKNPELKYVAMGPHDGGGYCQCEGCKAMDRGVVDPLYHAESMTDRYITFFNRVLDALDGDYPDLHIVWYVYAQHMMPPVVDPNPRIVPVFAPISLDRLRGMDNPMSPDRHVLRWLIEAWSQRHPNEMYYRGYYNNLACPQFPKTQIDRVRHEIPALRAKGVNVMRVEVIRQSWATDPLTLYLAARLMWDTTTDVDAVLEEFHRLFYGPAAEPMRRYHQQLEAAFRDTPYFTGSSYVYFPVFLDHPRRDDLRALLDQAAALAGEDRTQPPAARVRMIRAGYDRMDRFLDMIEARNRHDFAAAHQQMMAYEELTETLVDTQLEPEPEHRWVHLSESGRRGRASYFNRFFRDPVQSGYGRTVTFGDLAAALPDEWDFLLDPNEIGEIAGYNRPGELGGNWRPIMTRSRSWSDQGLHYYKGAAWYRARVVIPAAFEGRPLYLWFGGIDRVARVWINGRYVGSSREPEEGLPGAPGTFRPFDMPATRAAHPGEPNWVVVKIEPRVGLAELGTGGILAPVMFWSPHDPDWKPGQ